MYINHSNRDYTKTLLKSGLEDRMENYTYY